LILRITSPFGGFSAGGEIWSGSRINLDLKRISTPEIYMARLAPDSNSELLKIRAERERLEHREKQLLRSVQSRGLNEIVRIAGLYQLDVDRISAALSRRTERATPGAVVSSGRKVDPKFRDPADPAKTWSGRGKKPHWVQHLETAGRLDSARISQRASV
jgi:DNA-binding protein H-NS